MTKIKKGYEHFCYGYCTEKIAPSEIVEEILKREREGEGPKKN